MNTIPFFYSTIPLFWTLVTERNGALAGGGDGQA